MVATLAGCTSAAAVARSATRAVSTASLCIPVEASEQSITVELEEGAAISVASRAIVAEGGVCGGEGEGFGEVEVHGAGSLFVCSDQDIRIARADLNPSLKIKMMRQDGRLDVVYNYK